MFPIRRFYTPSSGSSQGAGGSASERGGGVSASLGSRLGALAGSTYERVGEDHPHPHLADLADHHMTGAFHAAPAPFNLHQPHPPPLDTTGTDTEDDNNPEAAVSFKLFSTSGVKRRVSRVSSVSGHIAPGKAAAMGAGVGPDGLPIVSFLEKAKFYTSLCFGTTAILAVFGFLFLIPFIVDPAISALAADFDPKAVTCVVSSFEMALGLRNCTWSSCREGCTTAALKCTLVKVNYSRHYFDDIPLPSSLDFNVTETKFFINTEGCGYPPRVNCTEFAKKMQNLGEKPFPCFVSNTYPELVVAEYSWEKTVRNLVLALVAPPVVFGFTVGVLIFWYCPACSKEKADDNGDGEELQADDEEY